MLGGRITNLWSDFQWRSHWRQALLILSAIVILVLMVVAAERSREDADRHLRAQAIVETVRASSEQLSAISSAALVDSWSGPHPHLDASVVTKGFATWNELAAALNTLRSLVPADETAVLRNDAGALFLAGIHALRIAQSGRLRDATRNEEMRFRPALDQLNGDAASIARLQRAVAARASRHAVIGFVGSLVIGLLGLVLLGWRHERLRRDAALALERRSLERRSEERIRALLEHSTDVATLIGADLRVQWQASSIKPVLGYEPGELVGEVVTAIVDKTDRKRVEQFLAATAELPDAGRVSARFRHADGSWREVEVIADNRLSDPAVEGIVLSMRDVTERKALEDELRHRAFHDPLTGLANRALFEDRLERAVARARRHERPFAVLFLDLDDFKRVNDSLGHAGGDELLRTISHRVRAALRPFDTAARMGGDEFAILIESLDDEQMAQGIAQRVLDAVGSPCSIHGREIRVSASGGIAMCSPADDAKHVLRHADIAMYAAKEQGKASLRVFGRPVHEAPSVHAPQRT